MSRYYKAKDVIMFLNMKCPKDMWEYQIADLPTIEVSEDAISRAEAIECISELPLDEVIIKQALKTLPSVVPSRAEGEWIPCSERLPNKYKTVLTTSKDGRVRENFINVGGWSYDTYAVVAWMPLPEPWKGAEK